jgi:hypothetical protein
MAAIPQQACWTVAAARVISFEDSTWKGGVAGKKRESGMLRNLRFREVGCSTSSLLERRKKKDEQP